MATHAIDVDLNNFAQEVLDASMTVPVVVDFWAPWCQPCQTLKPILEKLAEEYGGAFRLAKINADENPDLAREFGVRGIPAVKVVDQGRLVDEFSGALTESEVRRFLDALLPEKPPSLLEEAHTLRAAGQLEDALAVLVHASQQDPADEAVRLEGAEILIELGRDDEAQALLGSDFTQEAERADSLRARLALKAQAGNLGELATKLEADPDDHATRLEYARALAAHGQLEGALEAALEVVRRDRSFDEDGGRRQLLKFFEMFAGSPEHDTLVRRYRRNLSALLN